MAFPVFMYPQLMVFTKLVGTWIYGWISKDKSQDRHAFEESRCAETKTPHGLRFTAPRNNYGFSPIRFTDLIKSKSSELNGHNTVAVEIITVVNTSHRLNGALEKPIQCLIGVCVVIYNTVSIDLTRFSPAGFSSGQVQPTRLVRNSGNGFRRGLQLSRGGR